MSKVVLVVDGMTCSACSNGLEKYLNKQKGIISASVNLVMSNASIEYEDSIKLEEIENYISNAGFKSLGVFNGEIEIKSGKNGKKLFILFSVLVVFLLYISMGHMIGLPILNIFDMNFNPIIYTLTLFFITVPFFIYGFDILKNGYKNLLHRTPNMDTLVSIGVLSSFIYSIYSMYMVFIGHFEYVKNLYFESVAVVIFFVKLGRYIDRNSKDKTKEAIKELVKITPNEATLKDGRKVTIDEVRVDDVLVSKPGEKIAVDGEIISGFAHLDESFITGESKPRLKKVNDNVIAGSINYDGYLEYKAKRIGKNSTISEVVRLVVEATNTKAPIAKLADKVSGFFVPVVICLAFITLICYLLLGFDLSQGINAFVNILVIACPCSLGLATPLAIIVSEGLCISNGILVKKGEVLENARKVDTIVFDKTGTLTYGTLKVSEIFNYSNLENDKLMQLVGSVESNSSHPIGKAFLNYIKEKRIDILNVDKFEEISGLGIVSSIKNDEIMLGNVKILEKYNINNVHKEDELSLAKNGSSIVYVIINREVAAIIGVNDVVRDNTKSVIEYLKNSGIEPIMLTGDNENTAKIISKNIGIDNVIANVLPKEKANVIKSLKKDGKYVMMCGDGINDSPSLALCDVGVSMNSGTDIAMDSSDVILTKNDLYGIINLINISKKTVRNIKQNLFWAFLYNFLMIPIAMGILTPIGITINPMIASMAMVLSSLCVVLNALRLKTIKLRI